MMHSEQMFDFREGEPESIGRKKRTQSDKEEKSRNRNHFSVFVDDGIIFNCVNSVF